MSRLGQQMFSVRKHSANAAAAARCFLRESEATAAKGFYLCESVVLTQRQQHDVFCAKAKRQQQKGFICAKA
ncbi:MULTISPECIES: hypothetical protein [Lysinibacillus]|uniref:hypothetical protein n=1 Tax=Lysinibacillus TaxID=400634 RepID=UPI00083C9650|nr:MULTISPECIES: hypothetical protein [Lysinibacillus]